MGIRLLLAEDHPWVRQGIRETFDETEIEIVAEATTGDEAVEYAVNKEADVMLLDIKMPNRDGFDVLQHVKAEKPRMAVLIYSHHERSDFQTRARELGASGYLHKRTNGDSLIDAIRKVSQGHSLWNADVNLQFEG